MRNEEYGKLMKLDDNDGTVITFEVLSDGFSIEISYKECDSEGILLSNEQAQAIAQMITKKITHKWSRVECERRGCEIASEWLKEDFTSAGAEHRGRGVKLLIVERG